MNQTPPNTPEQPEIISTQDARSGKTGNKVRYVLIFSVLLAVVLMVGAYVTAPDVPDDRPNSTESREPG